MGIRGEETGVKDRRDCSWLQVGGLCRTPIGTVSGGQKSQLGEGERALNVVLSEDGFTIEKEMPWSCCVSWLTFHEGDKKQPS